MAPRRHDKRTTSRPFHPQPAIRWLEPAELLRSAVRLVLAETFGDYADRREMMAGLDKQIYNESKRAVDDDAVWVDYVADLGDGFDATYSVAEAIATDQLEPSIDPTRVTIETEPQPLRRGRVLIMGGDEIYPYATKSAYRDRTVGPYEAALPWYTEADLRAEFPASSTATAPSKAKEAIDLDDDQLSIYAIPGNHDWYDGLSAFQKTFCTNQWIGAWRTRQSRSYFAVKLNTRCWIWGIDIALGEHIDQPQIAYFRKASERLQPGNAVILCVAKPYWEGRTEGTVDSLEEDGTALAVQWLQHRLIIDREATVPLVISGDKHHYVRRMTTTADDWTQHLIVAGGGGAYLSSTRDVAESVQVPDPTVRDRDHHAEANCPTVGEPWPTRSEATQLAWKKAWSRIGSNVKLALTVGASYAILALLAGVPSQGSTDRDASFVDTVREVSTTASTSLAFIVAALVIGVGLFRLANRDSSTGRPTAMAVGAAHTLAHVGGTLAAASAARWMVGGRGDAGDFLLTGAFGAVAGMVILTLYLLTAQHLGVNLNELSAGLRHEGYKGFLRLKVTSQHIEVNAIGLPEVHRRTLRRSGRVTHVEGERSRLVLIDHVLIDLGDEPDDEPGDKDSAGSGRDTGRPPSHQRSASSSASDERTKPLQVQDGDRATAGVHDPGLPQVAQNLDQA